MGRYLTCEFIDKCYEGESKNLYQFLFSITEYNINMFEDIRNSLPQRKNGETE